MLVELSVVEQRYRAVMEVLEEGAAVVEVARRYGVARQTVHEWLARYANEGGLAGLADRSSRPVSCPHQMPPAVEALKRRRRREDYRRWERGRAMELWQMDVMGRVHLAGGQEVKVVTARWGAPEGHREAGCQNRDQVVAWWTSARDAGVRAVVTEVAAGAGTLLVGLEVTGTPAAVDAGGAVRRWQVLTLRGHRIADIRGFADRAAAAGHAGLSA